MPPPFLYCKLFWAPADRPRSVHLSLTVLVPCWRVKSTFTRLIRRKKGSVSHLAIRLYSLNIATVQRKKMTSNGPVEIGPCPALTCSVLCKTVVFWTVFCPQGLHFPNSF